MMQMMEAVGMLQANTSHVNVARKQHINSFADCVLTVFNALADKQDK